MYTLITEKNHIQVRSVRGRNCKVPLPGPSVNCSRYWSHLILLSLCQVPLHIMSELSEYELEREANIARNRALLEQLGLDDTAGQLGVPKAKAPAKTKAKPIQPAKRVKREREVEAQAPRRQSSRLKKEVVDLNESPSKKRKREAEQEERRRKEEDERLEAEEKARVAKRPRHEDLDLDTLTDDPTPDEVTSLRSCFQSVTQISQPKRVGDRDAFVYDADKKDAAAVKDLRDKLQKLKVVARAKVTQDRVYSAAYHPEVSKDLIFFGDKHGQLGIWDARATPDEVADEDGDVAAADDKEGGKYWRLQQHWPATSKSSISSIKLDPIDSHSVFTTSYDCTIRRLSFVSGISQEIFSSDETLITSVDLPPGGNEMWISDAAGGLTHLDLRQDKSKARWYGLSDQKIGSVSINPTTPQFLLTASNNRQLKIWDSRKLATLGGASDAGEAVLTGAEFGFDTVQEFVESKKGAGCLRSEFAHGKSVSSAYWDPRGRSIVSTSYDDTLRLWDLDVSKYTSSSAFPSFTPFSRMKHNCQTGKWLTILRAVWTPNPDIYPHFTIANMDHSLDIVSCKGDLIARLSDRQRITAVQAVTCSHPGIVERAATGNASGRCVLWAPADL
ncbi:WD40-repeat-containing domain protein [Hygrophoropsis aurantiaca]|uniref:WD40-repeat-containing domain protein n=1 Tax=Hygrophoropsis aurantiaca TaxID=72124 RepID=A0ACB8AAS8_9AGAM|nr:WD40-repeat-containing domain protein [Hygrophoropsis aurantiaca]